eukprot:TRINITY_DN1120_c0_g1_i20.p1 TRINITY_DN1120_c0_g1~~TRINITY_DN1120_c0_g1_i20.p1  ORF type:complete len:183 (-),score=40.75 TRINITY_DN1120_c0_g1_i20:369-917(-)
MCIRDSLLSGEMFSDVTFVVQNEPIRAHKAILCARSEHFRGMFSSHLKESQSNQVIIPDCSPKVFKQILKYLYTDQVEIGLPLNIAFIKDLLVMANQFLVPRLKSICELVLCEHVDHSNVIELVNLAEFHNAETLKKKCLNYLITNKDSCMQSPDVKNLSKDILLELFRLSKFQRLLNKKIS